MKLTALAACILMAGSLLAIGLPFDEDDDCLKTETKSASGGETSTITDGKELSADQKCAVGAAIQMLKDFEAACLGGGAAPGGLAPGEAAQKLENILAAGTICVDLVVDGDRHAIAVEGGQEFGLSCTFSGSPQGLRRRA